ncbi:MAG: AAC(3) family N-acetyltransferase [Clostridiaceae bacterium]|nr:AAC(3) family N-acetyltransferase [Clostridiaceae bacterium]
MAAIIKEELVRDLRALGVTAGMKLQVHSSMSRIGWVDGGADTVLDALMTVLTPEGTLMLPSFNHGGAYADGGCFDVASTPTSNGKIPDAFWRRADVCRGVNPTHPFAAWGKNAAYYVTHDQEAPTMGADSPLDRLMRDGGYVLLLGVGYISNTFHHLVEVGIGAPCLAPCGEVYPVRSYGGHACLAHTWSWRGGVCPVNGKPEPLYADAMRAVERRGRIGGAESMLFPMREAYTVIARTLEPYCKACAIRPRSCEYTWNASSGK